MSNSIGNGNRRNFLKYVPTLVALLSGVAILILEETVDKAIQGAGVFGPEALIAASPVISFVGGLMLLLLSPDPSPDDESYFDQFAREHHKQGALTIATYESHISDYVERQKIIFRQNLEPKYKMLGFGFLACGFFIQMLTFGIDYPMPVVWAGYGLMIIGAVASFVLMVLYLRWRDDARSEANTAIQ